MKPLYTLIYLHGFKSSAFSQKSCMLKEAIEQQRLPVEYLQPELNDLPDLAIADITSLIEQKQRETPEREIVLVGSSLGGFYATHFANTHRLRAIVINPVVRPDRLIEAYLGENQNPYSGKTFYLTPGHLDVMKSIYHQKIETPDLFLVLLAMNDEVLDTTEACRHYLSTQCMITPFGDHSFQDFGRFIPLILDWVFASSTSEE